MKTGACAGWFSIGYLLNKKHTNDLPCNGRLAGLGVCVLGAEVELVVEVVEVVVVVVAGLPSRPRGHPI